VSKNSSPRYRPWIFATAATNITITGGGTLDAQGAFWWALYGTQAGLNMSRPFLLEVNNCTDVVIQNLRVLNSPFWTLHIYNSHRVLISDVEITNPVHSPNTDGVDIDSSQDVHVASIRVSTGDDDISVKSGEGVQGRSFATPSQNVLIENSEFLLGSGLAFGSEGAGGFRNVTIRNCHFDASANVVRVKGCSWTGGSYAGIQYENITADLAGDAIFVDLNYECQNTSGPYPPLITGLEVSGLTANALRAGAVSCLTTATCSVSLSDVHIRAAEGFTCVGNVTGAISSNVSPRPCWT
jgi:polygalacturonase